jgi:hypothetical protein
MMRRITEGLARKVHGKALWKDATVPIFATWPRMQLFSSVMLVILLQAAHKQYSDKTHGTCMPCRISMDTLQYWRLILSLPTGKSSTRARAGRSSLVKCDSQLKMENLLEAYQREHGGCEAANLSHSIPTSFHSCGEYQLIMGRLVREEASKLCGEALR